MAWYVYVRMSHRSSANSGISEDSQIRACMEYLTSCNVCDQLGKHKFPNDVPDGVFVDRGKSGWSRSIDARGAGVELLRVLKPGDHIVFYNVERAFRHTINCLTWVGRWLEQDITPHFATERIDFTTAGGRFVGSVVAAAAQYYSDLISERTKEALAIRRERLGLTVKTKLIKHAPRTCGIIQHAPPAEEVPSELPRALVYNRVSHLDQTISGLSMEKQREENLKLAGKIPGITDVAVFEDESISAFSKPFASRPGAIRLLTDLKRGDHVIIYRVDRAFRNIRDACYIEKELRDKGVSLHITREGIDTGNEYGRMFFQILAMFSEMESSMKSQRQKENAAARRQRGDFIGGKPRHLKSIGAGRNRVVVHDYDAIVDCFFSALLLDIGFKGGIAFKIFNTDKVLAEYSMRRAWLYRDNIRPIIATLPKAVCQVLMERAIDQIKYHNPKTARLHNVQKYSFPIHDIEDRLAACDISPELRDLLPSHLQSAIAQA